MTRRAELPRPGDPIVRTSGSRRPTADALPSPPSPSEIALAPTIGVLGVQGDVSEHVAALGRVGARAIWVRRPDDLDGVDGLILPGGESTTLRRLLDYEGLLAAIRERAREGMPVFGTCAGAILLAEHVTGAPAPHLSLVPISVSRNAYGRQRESFVTDLRIEGLAGGPLRAVFIRAPIIEDVGEGVAVLARAGDAIALVETESALVATFHPELTGDDRLHRRFVEKTRASRRVG